MAVQGIYATPRVLIAVRGLLIADAALTARLHSAPSSLGGGPGIYTEGAVPAGAQTDYLTIGPFTETPDLTMGSGQRFNSTLTMALKLVTKSLDVYACQMTVDRVVALLHSVPIVVQDYAAAACCLETAVDAYTEMVAGVQMTHYPTVWRLWLHQAS